ncbi:MAG: 16S rRNA (cytidine(1402)-2'-O)-methyltransferase [Desulfovibrionaceae bacterium]
MSLSLGTLWVVGTPLGNILDLSPRAKQCLQSADILLVEDISKAKRLLQSITISAQKLYSFQEHNEKTKLHNIVTLLQEKRNIALISDAGMPIISDPGYLLVKKCREENIHVCVIPGPCAPITALVGSGIAPLPFTFLGFLPRTTGDREKLFSSFIHLNSSLIFFERKNRVHDTITVAHDILGDRELCIARELTKTHEEYLYTSLKQYRDTPNNLLGEVTIVIGKGNHTTLSSLDEIHYLYKEFAKEDMTMREIIKKIHTHTTGLSTKELYAILHSYQKL